MSSPLNHPDRQVQPEAPLERPGGPNRRLVSVGVLLLAVAAWSVAHVAFRVPLWVRVDSGTALLLLGALLLVAAGAAYLLRGRRPTGD